MAINTQRASGASWEPELGILPRKLNFSQFAKNLRFGAQRLAGKNVLQGPKSPDNLRAKPPTKAYETPFRQSPSGFCKVVHGPGFPGAALHLLLALTVPHT